MTLDEWIEATPEHINQTLISVCECHGVSFDDVMGKSRQAKIVAARRACVAVLRALKVPLETCGVVLGDSHHTTIMNLERAVGWSDRKAAA